MNIPKNKSRKSAKNWSGAKGSLAFFSSLYGLHVPVSQNLRSRSKSPSLIVKICNKLYANLKNHMQFKIEHTENHKNGADDLFHLPLKLNTILFYDNLLQDSKCCSIQVIHSQPHRDWPIYIYIYFECSSSHILRH